MDCVLPPAFFQRPAAKVARDLLGKHLIRMSGAMQTTSVIFETEAYEGTHDLASHSSRGRTPRTEVMFGPAGRFYVYRVYGLHWMLNIVTGEVGDAAAVLIRGIEGTSGPGRVAAALGIDGVVQRVRSGARDGTVVRGARTAAEKVSHLPDGAYRR